MSDIDSFRSTKKRYTTLKILAGLVQILGVFLLIAAVITFALGIFRLIAEDKSFGGILGGFPMSFILFIYGMTCLAFSALCELAINVEENTRATAQALEKISARLDARTSSDLV